MAEILLIPCLQDNYSYLIHEPEQGKTAAVDPAQAAPVLAALTKNSWSLDYILCTHHHGDHVGGNLELKRITGCQIIGCESDTARIPGIDLTVQEGSQLEIGNLQVEVLFTPGHTSGHLSYYLPQEKALFCGDVLFSLGCGRLFEGTAQQMLSSLEKLCKLPEQTKVFCGHEYTLNNARFALSVDSDNDELKKRVQEVQQLTASGLPTIPSTIGVEKQTNPFLRAADPGIQSKLSTKSALETFTKLRQLKDSF